jgi:hypothetical protein
LCAGPSPSTEVVGAARSVAAAGLMLEAGREVEVEVEAAGVGGLAAGVVGAADGGSGVFSGDRRRANGLELSIQPVAEEEEDGIGAANAEEKSEFS